MKEQQQKHLQHTLDLQRRVFHGFLIRKQTSPGTSHASCLTMEIKVFPFFQSSEAWEPAKPQYTFEHWQQAPFFLLFSVCLACARYLK